jgi:hypothetical protein
LLSLSLFDVDIKTPVICLSNDFALTDDPDPITMTNTMKKAARS